MRALARSAVCLLQPLRVGSGLELAQRLLHREARVPDLEIAHRGEAGHRLPVRAGRGQHGRFPFLPREAVVAAHDREARRQALHVPLPRPRRRLVEVVDVEDEDPLRRAERAEVREVRVAAQLGANARVRRPREIRRHDQCAAAVEGERRRKHPAVPDRHQLGVARDRLLLEQGHRVPITGDLDLGLERPRHLDPCRLAARRTLGRGEVRDDLGPTCLDPAYRRLLLCGHAMLELSPLPYRRQRLLSIARPHAQPPDGWRALTEREMSEAALSHLTTLGGRRRILTGLPLSVSRLTACGSLRSVAPCELQARSFIESLTLTSRLTNRSHRDE